jgi:hypothetical protein
MKYLKNFKERIAAFFAILIIIAIPIGACKANQSNISLNLDPIPYEFLATENLIERLEVEELTTGDWAADLRSRNGEGVLVMYRPSAGEPSILMGVYIFPEKEFDAAQNPNEPPPFGSEVIRDKGKVLAIAGPHDTIFDPATDDGKNIIALNELIYLPESYR